MIHTEYLIHLRMKPVSLLMAYIEWCHQIMVSKGEDLTPEPKTVSVIEAFV